MNLFERWRRVNDEPVTAMRWTEARVLPSIWHKRCYPKAKRVIDMLLCVIALPFFIPVMLFCAIAIWLDSPGPIIFVQQRIGKGGRLFQMYKFRTMPHNLDDSFHRDFMGAFVEGKIGGEGEGNQNDNRKVYKPVQTSEITRVGSILRKTSLDELPQVFNVLKGEMSLVGPRPNVPWEVEKYQPWHYKRLEVLPGITGLAQVRGRSCISFDRIVQCDVEYVERQSLGLDFKILWWTLFAVFLGMGAQ